MAERFSASNAGKHMACTASANLEKAIPHFEYPETDNVFRASDEGTAAHAVFELLMNYSAKDMLHFARLLDYVAELRTTRRFKVLTEQTVEATWLPPDPKTGKVPETTVDLVLFTADEIHVIDLKWGRVFVDVFDNVQLKYYARCFMDLAPRAKEITLHILQPRADNMERWSISRADLMAWADDAIVTQQRIHVDDLTFGPSDYCMFCAAYPHSRSPKGKPLCPATMQILYPTIGVDVDAMLED